MSLGCMKMTGTPCAAASTTPVAAMTAMGYRNVMWGSDYPVVSSREGYANALNWTRAALSSRPAAEIDAMFGGNARAIFFPAG